jgi:hypothetical protein
MGKLAALTEAYMIKQMEGATPAQTRLHFMASYAIDAARRASSRAFPRESRPRRASTWIASERGTAQAAAGNYFVV